VISNGLKQPVTDRALIGNRLYKLIADRFDICNGCLRSPLPEVHIGNGRCRGQLGGRPGVPIGNGRQTTTVTDVGGRNGR
jgi:hypothetical protein